MRTGRVARVDVFVDAERTVTGQPVGPTDAGQTVARGDGP